MLIKNISAGRIRIVDWQEGLLPEIVLEAGGEHEFPDYPTWTKYKDRCWQLYEAGQLTISDASTTAIRTAQAGVESVHTDLTEVAEELDDDLGTGEDANLADKIDPLP